MSNLEKKVYIFSCTRSDWLISRVLATHHGGPGSIPGQGMSVLGPLVKDGYDLGNEKGVPYILLNY
jgi:hypothetical protein